MLFTVKQYQTMIQEVFDYFVRSPAKEPYVEVTRKFATAVASLLEQKRTDVLQAKNQQGIDFYHDNFCVKAQVILPVIFQFPDNDCRELLKGMVLSVRRGMYGDAALNACDTSTVLPKERYTKAQCQKKLKMLQIELEQALPESPELEEAHRRLEELPDDINNYWRGSAENERIHSNIIRLEKMHKEQLDGIRQEIAKYEHILDFWDTQPDTYAYVEKGAPLTPREFDTFGFDMFWKFGINLGSQLFESEFERELAKQYNMHELGHLTAADFFALEEAYSAACAQNVLKSSIAYKQANSQQLCFWDASGAVIDFAGGGRNKTDLEAE